MRRRRGAVSGQETPAGARRSLPTRLGAHIGSEAQGRHVVAVAFDEPPPRAEIE
jgi:hypothetical protein